NCLSISSGYMCPLSRGQAPSRRHLLPFERQFHRGGVDPSLDGSNRNENPVLTYNMSASMHSIYASNRLFRENQVIFHFYKIKLFYYYFFFNKIPSNIRQCFK